MTSFQYMHTCTSFWFSLIHRGGYYSGEGYRGHSPSRSPSGHTVDHSHSSRHPPAPHDSAHHHLHPTHTHHLSEDHHFHDGQPSRSKSTSPMPHSDDVTALSVPPDGGGPLNDSSQSHEHGSSVEQPHQDVESMCMLQSKGKLVL